MGDILYSFNNMRRNLSIYLKWISIFSLVQIAILLPLFSYFFFLILHLAGVQSLNDTNLFDIFGMPVILSLLIVLVLAFLFIFYYEIGIFILLAHNIQNQIPFTLRSILKTLTKKARYMLSLQVFYFLIYFFLLMPIAGLILPATLTENLYLPHFIIDELMKSWQGAALYIGVFLLVFYLSMRLLYALPFFIIEKELTIFQAIKKSFSVPHKILLQLLVEAAVSLLVSSLIFSAVLFLLGWPVDLLDRTSFQFVPFFAGVILTCMQVFAFIYTCFIQGYLTQLLIAKLTIQKIPIKTKNNWTLPYKKSFITLLVITFIVLSYFNINSIYQTLYTPNTLIIAHRGDTKNAIENTLPAFKNAAKNGADYAELDVLETKDHQFVVFHDSTLRRLAGQNDRIQDLTADQLTKIELRSGNYRAHIPTLEETIALAKSENLRLLIEIKKHGGESADMEERFVRLLQKEKVTKDYLVQSLYQDVNKRIKELDPTIKTGMVTALNIGNLPKTEDDFIVLEDFSVTNRILFQANQANKDVFIWTVNQESLMRHYLQKNVDGLITNYPKRASKLRQTINKDTSLRERIENQILD